MTSVEKADAPLYPSLPKVAFVAACFKVLLFPAYHSTDFEVHRNWLAITYSLPPWKWYFENTSEWTLDYPPFFAGFEWLLAQGAAYVDAGMLNVKALGYDSWQTVVFQRSSVILTEGTLLLALHLYIESQPSRSTRQQALTVALSIFLSPGLLIIDHIHFQYNGFMYGLLVLSLILARKPSGRLYSGLLFGALLCFKHIYLYLAPAYFVFLLRGYCLGSKSIFDIQFVNCIKLGVGLIAIFSIAFGPFVYWGQMEQLLSRLFPFSRGLCHAYWAPNVWALYSFVDRVLLIAAQKAGWNVNAAAIKSVTRGLVGDTAFAILPEITPRMTFILTLFFQVVPLVKVFFRPTWTNFIASVTLCGYASFLFGWHVHEKAVLLMLIPFSLIVLQNRRYLSCFRPLAIAGHISLFPLLFTNPESTVKIFYTLFWLIVFMYTFDKLAPAATNKGGSGFVWAMVDRVTGWYGLMSIPLVIYTECFHSWLWSGRYEFLPLMAVSVFTAIGVVGSWLGTMAVFLLD